MAKCGSTSIGLFRLLLNLGIIAGAGMVLYGVFQSRSNVEKVWGEKQCLLWANVKKNSDQVTGVTTSPDMNCNFNVIGAIVSILVAMLLTAALIYQLAKGNSHERTCMSWMEVLLMTAALALGLVMCIISTGGVAVFCGNMRALNSNWKEVPCKEFRICATESCSKNYFWYKHLDVAQIGSWFVAGGWLLHMIFSVFNCCQYRKSKRVKESSDLPGENDKLLESMHRA